MRSLLLILSLLFSSIATSFAQYYNTGSDPWHTRWRKMESDGISLVYDSLAEQQAQYLFPLIPRDYRQVSNGRLWNRSPLPVLLHSAHANSNGMVSWAPRRMELYSYADVESDCVPWLRHLAIHEGRHAWQMSLVENGQTAFLNFLFGQQATGLVTGLFVPRWFLEGDAVWKETDATNGGRGRNADWLQQDIALALNNEMPSYEQYFFGSYRNLYPDFYHMGYLLVAYGRMRYNGANADSLDIWHQVLHEAGRAPLSITPFSRRLRQLTGSRKNNFYRKAISYWHTKWKSQYHNADTVSSSLYVSYEYPQLATNGDIVTYRIGISDIPAFVRTDSLGREQVVAYPSVRTEDRFCLHGDTIMWTERKPHPRWENASKSVIMWSTLSDGYVHTIERDWYSHLLSPSISYSGDSIVAVEELRDGHRDIVIMDFQGNVSRRISFPIPYEPQSPIFLSDGALAYILLSEDGKSIVRHCLESDSVVSTRPEFHNIRNLSAGPSGSILYSSDCLGNNNIYALDSSLGALWVHPECSLGVSFPSYSGKKLLFSKYTRAGYKPVQTDFVFVPDSSVSLSPQPLVVSPSIPKYPSEKYSHLSSLFSIHSWAPLNINPSTPSVSGGPSIMSQNLLGSLTAQAGMNIDPNSDERFYVKLNYSALWPIFSLKWTNHKERVSFDRVVKVYVDESELSDGTLSQDTMLWRCLAHDNIVSNKLSLGVSLPLVFSHGAWNSSLSLASNVEYLNESGYDLTCIKYYVHDNVAIPQFDLSLPSYLSLKGVSMLHQFSASVVRRYALRQVGPRYGVVFSAAVRHMPWGNQDYGRCVASMATLYLPGIGNTHQIMTSIGYQSRKATTDNSKKYVVLDESLSLRGSSVYGNILTSPRGCNRIEASSYTLLKTSYAMPIVDPDLSLGPIAHIKRVVARGFYDRSWGRLFSFDSSKTPSYTQQSYGIELQSETYLLQLPYPVNIGCRLSRLPETKDFNTQLLLSISFR